MDPLHDVRFALRVLRKRPVASLTIVLTLALGIGANATMFAGFEAWVLRPLPFTDPESLVSVRSSRPKLGQAQKDVSAPDLRDWREQARSFATLAAFRRDRFNLATEELPIHVLGARVDHHLFPMLGIRPVIGRNVGADEDLPSGQRVALIGDRLWRERFGQDPAIVGTTIHLDDLPHQVIGVMAPGFAFPEWAELWVPLALDPADDDREQRALDVIGRLAPGRTIGEARVELEAVAARLAARHPATNRGWSTQVLPVREAWAPPVIRLAISLSLVAAIVVLLVICANVASLMLAQAAGRERETALRTALGASRRRLVRQTLTESTMLALAGGVLGLLLGDWWLGWTISWVPVDPPYLFRFDGLGSNALIFTFGLSLLAGLASGVAPLARSSGFDVAQVLKRGDRSVAGSGGSLRRLLVVGQLAFALVLVVTGLLMVLSFLNQQRVDPGYRTQGVMTARLSFTGTAFDRPADRVAALDRILTAVERLSTVRSAGATSFLPVSRSGYQDVAIEVQDRPNESDDRLEVTRAVITDGYLESLGIPLLAGRGLTAAETAAGGDVVLISGSLAERLWPGESALGRHLRADREGTSWRRVVGVVGRVDPGAAVVSSGDRPGDQIYVPFGDHPPRSLSLAVRSDAPPAPLADAIRQAIAASAPGVPASDLLTIGQAIAQVRFVARYFGRLFASYALLALAIAAVGAYGIIADGETRRRRETGIRIALGALPARLLLGVVMRGLGLGLAGVLVGTALAVPATRLLAGMLIGIDPAEPAVLVGVALLLLVVSGVASFLPARKAARLDPTEVLRLD